MTGLSETALYGEPLGRMDQSAAQTAVASFMPTGNEVDDVGRLYDLTDAIESAGLAADLTPQLLTVFERNPNADLGSPGPIIHCIETTGMDAFVPHLVASIRATPTWMTLWMAERCLHSYPPSNLLELLLSALRSIHTNSGVPKELREEAASTLASHGT